MCQEDGEKTEKTDEVLNTPTAPPRRPAATEVFVGLQQPQLGRPLPRCGRSRGRSAAAVGADGIVVGSGEVVWVERSVWINRLMNQTLWRNQKEPA